MKKLPALLSALVAAMFAARPAPAFHLSLGQDAERESVAPPAADGVSPADRAAAAGDSGDAGELSPGAWRGLDDTAAWSECVRTNTALRTSAQFRDERFLPLLRSQTLDRFAVGPDANAPWAAEAKRTIEEELRWIWRNDVLARPGADFGRAYDFTIREGSRDAFLTWMSILGQVKWHWDAEARKQLEAFEADLAELGDAAHPFDRLLAAHVRSRVDRDSADPDRLRNAFVAWAESMAGRREDSEAVALVILRFGGGSVADLPEALLSSGADRWIGLSLRGSRAARRADRVAARRDLEEAWSLHPEFPGPAAEMLRVAKYATQERDLWFRRGTEARIDYGPLYRNYAECLEGGGISDFSPLLRFAEACYATHRHDVPVAYQYAPLVARYRRLAGIPQEEFFRRREVFAKCDDVLSRQLMNADASPSVRETAALLLAAINYIHGDIEDALDAAALRTPNTYNGTLADNFDDWFGIMTVLDGLSGDNGGEIFPLFEAFREGDFDGCLARFDDVWHACRDLSHSEATLLSKIAAESWVAARYGTGAPFTFGVLRRRQFADWINWGWKLEETGDTGAATTRGSRERHFRLQHLLPRDIEIEGSFEGLGEEGRGALSIRFLSSASIYSHYGPEPDLEMKREPGRVGVRMAAPGGRTPPWSWHDIPDGPVRFHAVYNDGVVGLRIEGAEGGTLALAKKVPEYGHETFPERGGLVFVGENVRFFGVTVRKPR